jgi:hypothetical protein
MKEHKLSIHAHFWCTVCEYKTTTKGSLTAHRNRCHTLVTTNVIVQQAVVVQRVQQAVVVPAVTEHFTRVFTNNSTFYKRVYKCKDVWFYIWDFIGDKTNYNLSIPRWLSPKTTRNELVEYSMLVKSTTIGSWKNMVFLTNRILHNHQLYFDKFVKTVELFIETKCEDFECLNTSLNEIYSNFHLGAIYTEKTQQFLNTLPELKGLRWNRNKSKVITKNKGMFHPFLFCQNFPITHDYEEGRISLEVANDKCINIIYKDVDKCFKKYIKFCEKMYKQTIKQWSKGKQEIIFNQQSANIQCKETRYFFRTLNDTYEKQKHFEWI